MSEKTTYDWEKNYKDGILINYPVGFFDVSGWLSDPTEKEHSEEITIQFYKNLRSAIHDKSNKFKGVPMFILIMIVLSTLKK